ncbi:hypothetical protein [Glaciihabitans tibetensis]|uniref:hypothetical protein n=1 Tax=Glaciihabitans tibetensis TaxID=1266600 RepID=UPI0015E6CAAF|nr:hypothetical protein [Glaciihabitans tibetensis]
MSIALAFAAPAVEPGVYNYPLEESTFVVVQAASAVIYLVMAYGLMGLWWSRVVPPSIFGSSGALAAAGSLVLLAIVHLVSIAAAGFVDTAPFVDILNASFGVVTAASGLSLVLGGIAIMRGRAWAGRGAYVPLIMGIYVFAPLIPALLGPIILARIAVAGWCVLFVVLGVALLKLARSGRTGRAQPTRGVLTPG